MMIKKQSPNYEKRIGLKGGNRKPQTFKVCKNCNKEFGPVDRLAQIFCSYFCKKEAMKTGRKPKTPEPKHVINARRKVHYHIAKGNITRPSVCESCGCDDRKIEAAHYDYNQPLWVKWLCRSCHVKWDKAQPKI